MHGVWVIVGIYLLLFVLFMVHNLSMANLIRNLSSVLLIVWGGCSINQTYGEYHVRVWAWITGLTAVKVMDYAHEVKYTLVEHQADGTWVGHLNFSFKTGLIRLWPNGYVDPECACSFCYIWHPVDADLTTQLQLTHWDSWPNWSHWLTMSHLDMVIYRETLPKQ